MKDDAEGHPDVKALTCHENFPIDPYLKQSGLLLEIGETAEASNYGRHGELNTTGEDHPAPWHFSARDLNMSMDFGSGSCNFPQPGVLEQPGVP